HVEIGEVVGHQRDTVRWQRTGRLDPNVEEPEQRARPATEEPRALARSQREERPGERGQRDEPGEAQARPRGRHRDSPRRARAMPPSGSSRRSSSTRKSTVPNARSSAGSETIRAPARRYMSKSGGVGGGAGDTAVPRRQANSARAGIARAGSRAPRPTSSAGSAPPAAARPAPDGAQADQR